MATNSPYSKIYNCTHCKYSNSELFSIIDHMVTHAPIVRRSRKSCGKYITNGKLQKHTGICHEQEVGSSSISSGAEKSTASSSLSMSNGARKSISSHSLPSSNDGLKFSPGTSISSKARRFKCHKCGLSVSRSDEYTKHITKHTKLYRFKCWKCDKRSYHNRFELQRHLLKEHEQKLDDSSIAESFEWRLSVKEFYKDVPTHKIYPPHLRHTVDFPSDSMSSGRPTSDFNTGTIGAQSQEMVIGSVYSTGTGEQIDGSSGSASQQGEPLADDHIYRLKREME